MPVLEVESNSIWFVRISLGMYGPRVFLYLSMLEGMYFIPILNSATKLFTSAMFLTKSLSKCSKACSNKNLGWSLSLSNFASRFYLIKA
jgi:hypothetical protein